MYSTCILLYSTCIRGRHGRGVEQGGVGREEGRGEARVEDWRCTNASAWLPAAAKGLPWQTGGRQTGGRVAAMENAVLALMFMLASVPGSGAAGNKCVAMVPAADMFEAAKFLDMVATYVCERAPTASRFLDVADVFAGNGAMSKEAARRGLTSDTFEVLKNPKQNLLTKAGFFLLMDMILSITSGGILFAGPPCGLFVFISSSVHKRSASRPYGDEGNRNVRAANMLSSNLCIVLAIAFLRGVRFVIEQPQSSQLWKLPPVAELLRLTCSKTVFTFLGGFGRAGKKKLPKPTHLKGTLSNISDLARKKNKKKMSKEHREVFWETTSKGHVNGAGLKKSAAYTPAFCKAAIEACLASRLSAQGSTFTELAPLTMSRVLSVLQGLQKDLMQCG